MLFRMSGGGGRSRIELAWKDLINSKIYLQRELREIQN